METGRRPGHEARCFEHRGNRAVRAGDWKLVSEVTRGRWELYDLAADRTELNDLAEERPEKAAEPLALYKAWAERSNVRDPEEFHRLQCGRRRPKPETPTT